MRHLLAPLVLTLSLSTSVAAQDWARVATQADASTVSITHPAERELPDGSIEAGIYQCSGFVIDRARGFVLTCAHCLGEDPRVVMVDEVLIGGVLYHNPEADLAVLLIKTTKPALRPYLAPARKGEPLLGIGYGYGLGVTVVRSGHVAHPSITFEGYPGTYLMGTMAYLEGMSGGPVLNARGQVIGVIQQTNALAGIGRTMADVYAMTAAYWARLG